MLQIKKTLMIPIFAGLGLFCISGCDKKDITEQNKITGIVMETEPDKTFYLVNEEFDITGASIAVNYQKQNKEIVPITKEMVSTIDMSTPGIKKPMVTYKKEQLEFTTSFTIEVVNYQSVTNEEELSQALNNIENNQAIYLKSKETPYDMHHIEITKNIAIIGEPTTSIQVDSDAISGQAGIYIKSDDVTLSNLTIEMNGNTLHSLKASSNDTDKINNILLENVTIEGGKGVNFHKADATLRNCIFNVDETTKSVALSIASSNILIENCTIYNGTWGSIGLMHKTANESDDNYDEIISTYPGNTKVTFKGENTISNHVYIEYYKTSKNTIENLNWETITQNDTLIYWNPKIKQ